MKVNRKLSFVIGPQSGIRPRRKDLIPANDSPWPDTDLLLFVHSLEITFFSFTANFALPEEDKEAVVNNITGNHFPNLANSIVNHTSLEDRKKKKDKVKDRLAVWTESLAKHGQREESKEKEGPSKETKSWPEVPP